MDEFRIVVFPVIVGGGQRLFGDGLDMKSLEHVGTRTFDSETVVLAYRPAG